MSMHVIPGSRCVGYGIIYFNGKLVNAAEGLQDDVKTEAELLDMQPFWADVVLLAEYRK